MAQVAKVVILFGSLLVSQAQFDQLGYELIHDSLSSRPLDYLMAGVEEGSDPKLIALSLVGLGLFGPARERKTARLGMLAAGSGGITSLLIKALVARPRPENQDPSPHRSSFPSSHAAITTALATVYGAEYPSLRLPLAGVVGLVSFSRVYLGHHYPLDLLAGICIGYGLGRLALGLEHNLK